MEFFTKTSQPATSVTGMQARATCYCDCYCLCECSDTRVTASTGQDLSSNGGMVGAAITAVRL